MFDMRGSSMGDISMNGSMSGSVEGSLDGSSMDGSMGGSMGGYSASLFLHACCPCFACICPIPRLGYHATVLRAKPPHTAGVVIFLNSGFLMHSDETRGAN